MIRTLSASVLLFALAACAPDTGTYPDVPGNNPPDPGICNADKASPVVGQRISPQLEQEARARSGARLLRVMRPGQVVTQEYSSERLNLQLNDYDVVVRAYCG